VIIFDPSAFPGDAGISFRIADGLFESELFDAGTRFGSDWPEVVWLRRANPPAVSLDEYEIEDRQSILSDIHVFWDWALGALAPQARWINRYRDHVNASNKIRQYMTARQLGIPIPDTLFSNDAASLEDFAGAGTLCKPIARVAPKSAKDVKAARFVTRGELGIDSPLSKEPLFLQRCVDKRAELRVHVFGTFVSTVMMTPDVRAPARVDWNFERDELRFEATVLPTDLSSRLIQLARCLGVEFCTVDLALDRDGSFVFLELNQMGQFLWIEDRCPEAGVLEAFVSFILGGGRHGA
jgi:hypothetical protein